MKQKRWVSANIYFWQKSPIIRWLPPFIFGIISYDFNGLFQIPINIIFYATIFIGIAFTAILLAHQKSFFKDQVIFWLLQFFYFLIGALLTGYLDCRKHKNWIGNFKNEQYKVVSIIANKPKIYEKIVRIELQTIAIGSETQLNTCVGNAFIYCYKNSFTESLSNGDTVFVPNNWVRIASSGNPFEPNYIKNYSRRGLFFKQFVKPENLQLMGKKSPHAHSLISKIHDWCDLKLQFYLKDTATLGLIQAMLVGDESLFDPDLRQAYAETGVVHIVSISGSHTAMLFLFVTSILFWIKHPKYVWIKYVSGLILIWIYVLIAGAPPSAIRSAVMFTILSLGVLFNQQSNSLNVLSVAAFVMLCGNPNWLFSIGFQLSFVAVLSLIIYYKSLSVLYYFPNKYFRILWQAVAASIAAEILTAPLVIYYFHNFPLFFIVGNVLAMVLVGVLALVGGMLLLAFSSWSLVAQGIAYLITFTVHLFNSSIFFLQKLNPLNFQHLQINLVQLLLIYFLIITISISFFNKNINYLFPSLAASILLMSLFIINHYLTLKQEKLIVYNSGKENKIEIIKGTYFRSLFSATNSEKNTLTDAAHNGFFAWRKMDTTKLSASTFFMIKNKKIVCINDNQKIQFDTDQNIDVLIATSKMPENFYESIVKLHPKTLVIASGITKKIKEQWIDSCKVHSLKSFPVADSGAFVLD